MQTKKITFKIDIDVLHALIHALEPEETFDHAVERFLRLAFKAEIGM